LCDLLFRGNIHCAIVTVQGGVKERSQHYDHKTSYSLSPIQPQPGDEDSVLFCRVWLGVEQVRAQYNEETDWREVAKQAITVVK
jgi:hypothetical protein